MLVFKTPGVLPLDAVMTFGINAKPNTANPFGYFGTGLKYAVAVVLRLGGSITLLVEGKEYVFYVSGKNFRGKTFDQARMKKRTGMLSKWQYDNLPFTTELGKNWMPWQAFRELESNTRDEGGDTFTVHDREVFDSVEAVDPKCSYLLVECAPVEEAFENGDTFLTQFLAGHDAQDYLFNSKSLTIWNIPSKYLYYAGVRVYEFRHPARLTYNIAHGGVVLTEDRTASNIWQVLRTIATTLQTSNVFTPELLQQILKYEKEEKHFETHELEYNAYEFGTTEAFKQAARRHKLEGFETNLTTFHGAYTTAWAPPKAVTSCTLEDAKWREVITALLEGGHDELALLIADEVIEKAHYETEVERLTRPETEAAIVEDDVTVGTTDIVQ